MTELHQATPAETTDDLFKLGAMRLLVTPVDELANIFMAAFAGHKPILSKVNVLEGTIAITFIERRPMSDTIRETVLQLYNRHWGGKPDGLECVYKEATGFVGMMQPPTMIYVTVQPHALATILKESKSWRVIDAVEFQNWVDNLPPKHWIGEKSKDKVLVKNENRRHTVAVYENGLSGEPAPTVRLGLFKI